jgi:hypothetical protein
MKAKRWFIFNDIKNNPPNLSLAFGEPYIGQN